MTILHIDSMWHAAMKEGWEAFQRGSLLIGAVVVDSTGTVLGQGRNSISDTARRSRQPIQHHVLAHAEMNALLSCELFGPAQPGTQLYTTLEPCAMCAGAVVVSGIERVDYLLPDPQGGRADVLAAAGVDAVQWPVDRMAQAWMALFTVSLIRSGVQIPPRAILEQVLPDFVDAVELGQRLAASGDISRLAERNWPISQVLIQVERQLPPANQAG